MANKRKITTAIVAGVTALALMLGGTFAWQSINQTALNEASDVINPGGRLHDDFNGSNKDVYVENFADEPIFARIRLDEYFEIVMNKGVTGAEIVDSIAGEKDENGNITSWETHKFDGSDLTAPYWEWTTGGKTIYMPTFNLNKDSLVADINGTLQGKDGEVYDEMPDDRYNDYVEYAEGATEEGTEIYDGDTNMNDEVGEDFANLPYYEQQGNIVTVAQDEDGNAITHTAKETLGATLISMDEWMTTYNSQPGEYWVYDTDGWVYWAQAIQPGTATGKLLDGIQLTQVMDDSWYYAINVVAQFITADDLGKDDNTGFYDTENGTVPSDNALALLEKIGVETPGKLTITANAASAPRGGTVQFTATAEDGTEVSGLDWTVTAGTASTFTARTIAATSIDSNGLLSVATDEAATVLTVSASGKYTDSEGKTKVVLGSADIEVIDDPNIKTTDETTYPAYAILTDDGRGEGTYAMTMVRAAEAPAVGDYYNNQPIAEVYKMTGFRETSLDGIAWYYDRSTIATMVTSVYAANPIIADSNWQYAFKDLTELESADLTNVDFSKTTNPRGFFSGDSSLKEVKLPDTFGVAATNIEIIFAYCGSLTTLDLPDGFGSNATELYAAFRETGLTELTLPDGFGKKLNDDSDGCMWLFLGSPNLKSITLPEGFGENATTFKAAFSGCTSLESVNFPADFTSVATDMTRMFEDCSSLVLDCSGWTVTNCSSHDGFNENAPYVTAPTWG